MAQTAEEQTSPGPFAAISESHPTTVWLHCMHACAVCMHALYASMRCMHVHVLNASHRGMATLDEA